MPDQLVNASVEGITNNISIKAKKVQPEVIKQKIEEALKREVEREAHGISVEVSGGKVTLSGTFFFADFRNLQMNWNIFSRLITPKQQSKRACKVKRYAIH